MFFEEHLEQIKFTQQAARFAVKTLAEIRAEGTEADIDSSTTTVGSGELRNCLELLLSMLEDMGMDIEQEEKFVSLLQSLTSDGVEDVSVSIH